MCCIRVVSNCHRILAFDPQVELLLPEMPETLDGPGVSASSLHEDLLNQLDVLENEQDSLRGGTRRLDRRSGQQPRVLTLYSPSPRRPHYLTHSCGPLGA
jgi:hypothetical protein